MKVKNIAFSGFAAAILMAVSGAAQAAEVSPVKLASKGYVDTQVGTKQDKLTQLKNAGSGVLISDTGVISVDTDYIATNDSVTTKISGAITGGEEFKEAVQGAIDAQIQEGAIGTAIENAVTDAVSTKADQSDLEALQGEVTDLDTQINAEGTGLAAQIAAAASAASAAQGTADGAASAASTNAQAITALQNADTGLSGRLDTLEAIDHSAYALKTEVQAEDNAIKGRLNALETADHFTQEDADLLYAGIDTETVAANAATAAANAQSAAEAADTKAGNAATAAENAQTKADSAYTLADAAQTAEEVQSAINTKLATENYMSGNNIGAGSYLMMSDGEGGISWSSVVIVDENGDDIVLPSDAPKAL